MQHRVEQLNGAWRRRGFDQPIRARMGINTGYCHVGNFGSDDRMDYTIIGVEANLAARLQSIARPGGICISYETYALVRDLVQARPLAPIAMKGMSRQTIPYQVERLLGDLAKRRPIITEHSTGLDLFLDVEAIDERSVEHAKIRLSEALMALPTENGSRQAIPTATGTKSVTGAQAGAAVLTN